jgi:rhodanese-related sulfurtransferase
LPGATMAQVNTAAGYAGDLLPDEAWAMLKRRPAAQLVDVRTTAEWNFVGLPDLSSLGRTVHLVEWQNFPSMALNPDFVASTAQRLEAGGAGKETPVLLLCRSGARSRSAAIALTKAGYAQAFNIAGGFEGDADAAGHRGVTNGWKATGLPWRQA